MDKLKKESLAKWKRIIKGGRDFGPADCSYCQKYRNTIKIVMCEGFPTIKIVVCEGCPIYLKTGFNGCVGTPYSSWEQSCESLPLPGKYPNKLYNKEIDRKLYLRGVKIAAKMYAFIYNLPE